MKWKNISHNLIDEIEFDNYGNAIIKLPPGTTKIVYQSKDEGDDVKNIQFKILLSEIRKVSDKVDKNTKAISNLDAKLDKHIIEGH